MLKRHNPILRRGFTLIEVLVTISIIAILTAIAVTGFRSLQRTAATKKTKVALSNSASMLAEYDAATAFKQQPAYMWNAAATPSKVTMNFNIWRDGDPAAAGENPLKAPRGLIDSDAATPTGPRLAGQAVQNTAIVMRECSRMPGVKKMFEQSQDGTLKIPNEGNAIVLLDAWDNPIIYVPASGLGNVHLGDKDDTDPDKPFVISNLKTVLQGTLAATPVILPGARPFFASAGPDGVFDFVDVDNDGMFTKGTDIPAGNDNIYSFEN